DNMDTLFYRCYADDHYIWGFYFCPRAQADRISAVYASMHFEQMDIPQELWGLPEQVRRKLTVQQKDMRESLVTADGQMRELIESHSARLRAARKKLAAQSRNFDVRKLAACTRQKDREVFYILCGWMSRQDAQSFQRDIAEDPSLYCFVESGDSQGHGEPPTKLKNPKVFKPFEMFVRMYGLPSYHEMDPTIFVALT